MTDSDISVKRMYCEQSITPRNPTTKGHLCRRCPHDVQMGDRLRPVNGR